SGQVAKASWSGHRGSVTETTRGGGPPSRKVMSVELDSHEDGAGLRLEEHQQAGHGLVVPRPPVRLTDQVEGATVGRGHRRRAAVVGRLDVAVGTGRIDDRPVALVEVAAEGEHLRVLPAGAKQAPLDL